MDEMASAETVAADTYDGLLARIAALGALDAEDRRHWIETTIAVLSDTRRRLVQAKVANAEQYSAFAIGVEIAIIDVRLEWLRRLAAENPPDDEAR